MSEEIIKNYHADAVQSFRNHKRLADRAIQHPSDQHFFALIDPVVDSIAVTVKHDSTPADVMVTV